MSELEEIFYSGNFDKLQQRISKLIENGGVDAVKGLLWQGKWQLYDGKLDDGITSLNKGIERYHLLSNKEDGEPLRIYASILHYQGLYYYLKNEFRKANENYQNSKKIRETVNDVELSKSYNNLGLNYIALGDFAKAEQYLQKNYDISMNSNDDTDKIFACSSLLDFYLSSGDMNNYKAVFRTMKPIVENLEEIPTGFWTSAYEAFYYEFENKYDLALKYYKRGISNAKNKENTLQVANCYYHAIRVLINKNDRAKLEKYLKEFNKLNDEADNRLVTSQFHISKAKYLKTSTSFVDKAEAIRIFVELIDNENVNSSIKTQAMIGHIDMLLEELELSDSQQKVHEIKNYIQKYQNLIDPKVIYAKVRFIILESKFDVILGDLQTALHRLDEAIEFAEKADMKYLKEMVRKEVQELENQYEKWESLLSEGSELSKRIKESKIKEFINLTQSYM